MGYCLVHEVAWALVPNRYSHSLLVEVRYLMMDLYNLDSLHVEVEMEALELVVEVVEEDLVQGIDLTYDGHVVETDVLRHWVLLSQDLGTASFAARALDFAAEEVEERHGGAR